MTKVSQAIALDGILPPNSPRPPRAPGVGVRSGRLFETELAAAGSTKETKELRDGSWRPDMPEWASREPFVEAGSGINEENLIPHIWRISRWLKGIGSQGRGGRGRGGALRTLYFTTKVR